MDLMYGFRGNKCDVDLLSPYEMLLWWDLVRIVPPTRFADCPRSEWTPAGRAYTKMCQEEKVRPDYKAGIHYIATENSDRILLPDILQLCSLRHRWCWEKRQRPHIPTWSFAKVPSPLFSPKENARMLCVYMRPWTLNHEDSSRLDPRLSHYHRSRYPCMDATTRICKKYKAYGRWPRLSHANFRRAFRMLQGYQLQ